ncbi:MAG: DUF927 domain-containing protein [Proteobacteria bacterium]|nr:DUF927 domain-containing protein [Pseudomonadota bacterium]
MRVEIEEVRAALSVIAPVGHNHRVRIGMAVHSEFPGDDGLAVFDEWCQRGETYSAVEVRDSWRSFKPGPIGIGTLWHVAMENGYRLRPARGGTVAQQKLDARQRAELRAKQEAEYRQRADAAAQEAARIWGQATEGGTSEYLARKGVQGYGVRYLNGVVLVPVRNAAGELVNLQRIAQEKRFLRGGRKSGCWHLIGNAESCSKVVIVCEGYATAASVHEATGYAVAVAFDAGNLKAVALALREKHPAARLLIAGDDDRATKERTGTNPGRSKASAAARAVGGVAVFPIGLFDGGTDFNDLHFTVGVNAVRDQIKQALHANTEELDGDRADDRADARKALSLRPDRYELDDDGVWILGGGDDGQRSYVCPRLEAVALARDWHDEGAALVLRFDTRTRSGRQWVLPLKLLAGDGAQYRTELLDRGFPCPADTRRRAQLTEYLRSRVDRVQELVRHVSRVGWSDDCYVLPDETIGVPGGGERVIFHAESGVEARFSQAGTSQQWRDNLGRVCVGNSRLAFAVAAALAGPLFPWSGGTTGGGWHYVGDTSTGKTTGLLIAASVWGRGTESDPDSYLQKWRATTNGLEYLGEQHNHGTLVLDELGQMDPAEVGNAAYMLADGSGKTRARAGGGLRHRPSWRVLMLSSGELTLDEHMESAGRKMKGGHEVRLISVPAEVVPGSTLETTHEFEGGHELSVWCRLQTAKVYGCVGREWLEWLAERTDSLEVQVHELMESFLKCFTRDEMSGQVKRGARRFALAAAAGELATQAGITGWPEGEAMRAAGVMLNAWIGNRIGGIGGTEDALILRDIRRWFSANGDACFKRWSTTDADHGPVTQKMCGWRRDDDEDDMFESPHQSRPSQRTFYVEAEMFRAEVCRGHSYRRCIRVLEAHDLLVLQPDGRARSTAKPPGYVKSGVSVYRVKGAILGDLSIDDAEEGGS